MGAFKELTEQLSCSWNTSFVGKGVGKGEGVYCVMGVSDGEVDELRVLFGALYAHVQNCYRVLHQNKYWIQPVGAVSKGLVILNISKSYDITNTIQMFC